MSAAPAPGGGFPPQDFRLSPLVFCLGTVGPEKPGPTHPDAPNNVSEPGGFISNERASYLRPLKRPGRMPEIRRI